VGGFSADETDQLGADIEVCEVRIAHSGKREKEIQQFVGLKTSHREEMVNDLATALFLNGDGLLEFLPGDASGGLEEVSDASFGRIAQEGRPVHLRRGFFVVVTWWRLIRGIHKPLILAPFRLLVASCILPVLLSTGLKKKHAFAPYHNDSNNRAAGSQEISSHALIGGQAPRDPATT
jgi:hypothetical protein